MCIQRHFLTRRTPRSAVKRPPPIKPKPNTANKENKEKDPVGVFCRLRPLQSLAELACVYKTNDTTITLKSHSGRREDMHYSFKHVFDENVSQKCLFEHVALPLVKDTLEGKDCKYFHRLLSLEFVTLCWLCFRSLVRIRYHFFWKDAHSYWFATVVRHTTTFFRCYLQ